MSAGRDWFPPALVDRNERSGGPVGRTLLTNCVVVNGTGADPAPGSAIAVNDSVIEWVGPGSQAPEIPDVLDMQGYYVMPGLWDMHVHLGMRVMKSAHETEQTAVDSLFCQRRALAFLYSGVTSLRLVGSTPDGIDFALRDGINAGEYAGPRILTAGAGISSTGGHGYRGGEGCDGPYEFRRAARNRLWRGADLIKLMVTGGMGGRYEGFAESQTTQDEVAAAIDVAHNAGKHVAAHVASPVAAIMCSQAGLDTVEHGYALDEACCKVMAENGTAVVPTLVVTENPAYWEELGVVDWAMKKIRAARPSHRSAFEVAMRAGVTIAVGSDLPTAYKDGTIVAVREMEVMEELGANPADILCWATSVPAAICGLKGSAGVIAAGQSADVIAVPSDPTVSVSSLRDVRFVMARGGIVRDELPGHHPIGLPPGFLTGPC